MIFKTKNSFNPTSNPTSFIMGILTLLVVFVALYYLAKAVFWVLSVAAPILFVITLIMDHKVVVNYGKWLMSLTKRNPLLGIVAIILSLVGFPIVSFFLFGKAMLNRKVKEVKKDMEERREGKYIEYEEVQSKKTTLDLPRTFERPRATRPQAQTRRTESNEYEQLFDEDNNPVN